MTLDIGCYATTMARYNRWMNERLYSVAGTLTEQQLREERGLFFGSIYGTLNHLLVCAGRKNRLDLFEELFSNLVYGLRRRSCLTDPVLVPHP